MTASISNGSCRTPNVLIISAEVLNQSHGTGVLLLNYFRNYPPSHLMSLHRVARGESMLPQSAALPRAEQWDSTEVEKRLKECSFEPDIIYIAPVDEGELKILEAVFGCVRKHVPVIMHFMDYIPKNEKTFDEQIKKVLPRVTKIWGLTQSMCEMLTSKYHKKAEHVASLQQELPSCWREEHRPFSTDFRSIILGNFHNRSVIPLLKDTWRICSNNLPGLQPVQWFCDPLRRQAVIDAGYNLAPEIEWKGFADLTISQQVIINADLAILPFNSDSSMTGNYERYSIPSRVMVYAGAGIPIAVLASMDTEIAQLTKSKRFGIPASGPDPEDVAKHWTEFILSREKRANAGLAARTYAEKEFGKEPLQKRLFECLCSLTA